jgi:hypothetical protein
VPYLVRNHTTIPVPKVLAWSSDASNQIGTEYIIMEEVPGVQVFKKWDDMGEYNRISLIKNGDVNCPKYHFRHMVVYTIEVL